MLRDWGVFVLNIRDDIHTFYLWEFYFEVALGWSNGLESALAAGGNSLA